MAKYERDLVVPLSQDRTFAFVSDFRNAALWDPRTYAVEKATPGPIGVGTRFVLTGGLVPEHLIRQLGLHSSRVGMALPYDIVAFDPPHSFSLEGESSAFRYRDELTFAPTDGGACTHLVYRAELSFKGPLSIGEPLLRPVFRRIGDGATRDLPRVAAGARSSTDLPHPH